MAIILPHGVLFRGGAAERIRTKLLKDGHIDTVIGLPANLIYSAAIPVCILVLKKCKKPDDVLFINAAEPLTPSPPASPNAVRCRSHSAHLLSSARERQTPEPTERGAHRQDHRHLPKPHGSAPLLPPGGDG
jgi:type I restriction enzyme M protein